MLSLNCRGAIAWLQHFDGTKGCHICIIDMPPVHLPGVALWRRLLLGEGDGRGGSAFRIYGSGGNGMMGGGGGDGAGGGSGVGADTLEFNRDMQSPYVAAEEAAIADDKIRPAVRLARELQRAGFPFVTVLDGGFPSLIDQLIASRGEVEPVVINHDPERWQKYLISTGRLNQDGSKGGLTGNKTGIQGIAGKLGIMRAGLTALKTGRGVGAGSRSTSSEGDPGGDGMEDGGGAASGGPKKVKDMNELEVAATAYRVAARHGHAHMEAILLERLNVLSDFTTPTSATTPTTPSDHLTR